MTKEEAAGLKSGDYVYLTGTIYTARDAAHKRMDETLDQGRDLPFEIKDQIIYYMGPSPQGKAALSAQRDRPQRAVWTDIPASSGSWTWGHDRERQANNRM